MPFQPAAVTPAQGPTREQPSEESTRDQFCKPSINAHDITHVTPRKRTLTGAAGQPTSQYAECLIHRAARDADRAHLLTREQGFPWASAAPRQVLTRERAWAASAPRPFPVGIPQPRSGRAHPPCGSWGLGACSWGQGACSSQDGAHAAASTDNDSKRLCQRDPAHTSALQ